MAGFLDIAAGVGQALPTAISEMKGLAEYQRAIRSDEKMMRFKEQDLALRRESSRLEGLKTNQALQIGEQQLKALKTQNKQLADKMAFDEGWAPLTQVMPGAMDNPEAQEWATQMAQTFGVGVRQEGNVISVQNKFRDVFRKRMMESLEDRLRAVQIKKTKLQEDSSILIGLIAKEKEKGGHIQVPLDPLNPEVPGKPSNYENLVAKLNRVKAEYTALIPIEEQIKLAQKEREIAVKETEEAFVSIGAGGLYKTRTGETIAPVAKEGAEEKVPYKIELNRRALAGDKEAQALLDKMEASEIRIAGGKAKTTAEMKAGESAFSRWEPPEKEQAFWAKILTGKNPGFGWGDQLSKNAFEKEYNKFQLERGITPGQVVRMQTDYKSLDRSTANQRKSYDMMNGFVLNINKQMGEVEKMYAKLPRTQLKLLNLPIREIRTRALGSGEEAAAASYLLEISREIGKLSVGASASIRELSVEAQKQWDKIHDGTLPLKDLKFVLKTTQDQANMRLQSTKEAMDVTRNAIESISPSISPSKLPSSGIPSPAKAKKIGRFTVEVE